MSTTRTDGRRSADPGKPRWRRDQVRLPEDKTVPDDAYAKWLWHRLYVVKDGLETAERDLLSAAAALRASAVTIEQTGATGLDVQQPPRLHDGGGLEGEREGTASSEASPSCSWLRRAKGWPVYEVTTGDANVW